MMNKIDASQASELLNYLGEVCKMMMGSIAKGTNMVRIVERYWHGC